MSLKYLPMFVATIGLGCGARPLAPRQGGTGTFGVDGGLDAVRDVQVIDVRVIEVIDPPHQRCGNGVLDPGETCDDGNLQSGDGCTVLCQIECSLQCGSCGQPSPCISLRCGDGLVSTFETCDDSNTIGGDGCAGDCRAIEVGWHCPVPGRRCVPICGDGLIVGNETCDDGNTLAGDGCSDACLLEPSTTLCGNGVIEGAEECDDGANTAPGYGRCGFDCRFGGYCGDGIINGVEACDLGGNNNSSQYGNPAGCTSGCQLSRFCGDGIVDTDQGEECDRGAGNGTGGSPCTRSCKILI